MPAMLDPHLADIESWLAAEPQLTAIAIVGRLSNRAPAEFGPPQHSIVQRLLKTLRTKAAHQLIAGKVEVDKVATHVVISPGRQRASRPSPSLRPGNIPS